MQRFGRQISVIILIALLITLGAMPQASAKISLSQLQKTWSETARKISDLQTKLRPIKKQQKEYSKQLADSKRRLEVSRSVLWDIQSQLRNTRYKLATTRSELERIQARLNERNDLLAARLTDTYKHGNVRYASVLLGATDFWDLLSRGYVIRKVLQSDVSLIDAIKEDKQAVEQYKAVLEDQEQKRASLESKHAATTRSVKNQTAERARLLAQANSERAKYERMMAQELQSSRDIAAMIRQMQKTPAGKKRLSQVWHGSFMMPVQGRITSPFGMRTHPIYKTRRMHTGTDIACPSGTTVHAATGGYVAFSGWYGAYGNTVIIDHGGGVITFYGHCSSLLVRKGTTVKQGQSIARAGSTGTSTGPHVHFEVQKNGVPVSPF